MASKRTVTVFIVGIHLLLYGGKYWWEKTLANLANF